MATSSRVSTADTNKTLVKAGGTTLFGVLVDNRNAAARFLKFYDAAAAGDVAVGTTVPVLRIPIPGNTAGAGVAFTIPGGGHRFTSGMVYAMTTGAADTDTNGISASESHINVFYDG